MAQLKFVIISINKIRNPEFQENLNAIDDTVKFRKSKMNFESSTKKFRFFES